MRIVRKNLLPTSPQGQPPRLPALNDDPHPSVFLVVYYADDDILVQRPYFLVPCCLGAALPYMPVAPNLKASFPILECLGFEGFDMSYPVLQLFMGINLRSLHPLRSAVRAGHLCWRLGDELRSGQNPTRSNARFVLRAGWLPPKPQSIEYIPPES